MHRCWRDARITPLLADELAAQGATFPDEGPWTLYLPSTSGHFDQRAAQLQVPDGALVSALAGCDFITSKRSLWVVLARAYGLRAATTLTPPTWILDIPKDRARLRDEFTAGLYVLKAKREHRLGLTLARSLGEILSVKQDIVQRVITDGLQLSERRVQLRLYLLLTQHRGTLTAWLYRDGRCLYGAARGTDEDVYLFTKQPTDPALPRTLTQLQAHPRLSGQDLLGALRLLMRRLVRAARGYLLGADSLDHARCFQLLGVDVILRESRPPMLIEVNKGPSMIPRSEEDAAFKRALLRETLARAGAGQGDGSGFVAVPLHSNKRP